MVGKKANNRRRTLGLLAFFCCTALLLAQDSKQPPAKQAPQGNTPEQQSAPSPIPLPPMQLDGSAALHHLNQVINWYRHVSGIQAVGLPTDAIYQDNAHTLGTQAVRLAFQSAKAESVLLTAQQKASGTRESTSSNTQAQNLAQMRSRASGQIDQIQSQITDVEQQIEKAKGAQRDTLVAQRDALQGQLELQKALLDAIEKMASFIETNGETAEGLEGGINQLAKSIPEVLGTNPAQQKTATQVAPTPAKPTLTTSGGLISDAVSLYDYMRAVHEIDKLVRETDYTREIAERLRTPFRDALRSTIQEGQRLANQPPATDPAALQSEQKEFQALTGRVKQLLDALLPLSQESIVLSDGRTNFEQWRSSVARESTYILRSVLMRVLGIAIALVLILVLSDVWRRVTFRYINDPRRRRQFLVLRRIVIGFLIVIVLIVGFVSEFSSLATFAGFITAGIAVGLQAVLLSVAAYFFIIGRYGIRVGDRISVAGVTGDVVDVGLVRLYLMELAGTGLDFYPTGRIVVFSNSVLFQTATPLFKQIPGTEYAWHEVAMSIAPGGNHKAAEDKLVAAVNSVYAQYKEDIERQHAGIERRVDIQVQVPRPQPRLQFIDTGLELVVRYPVDVRRAADIDEEMTRQVLKLVETDVGLKAAVSGTPRIRSVIKT